MGLEAAADLVINICGGEVSNFDIQQIKKHKSLEIKFDPSLASKTIGIKIKISDVRSVMLLKF